MKFREYEKLIKEEETKEKKAAACAHGLRLQYIKEKIWDIGNNVYGLHLEEGDVIELDDGECVEKYVYAGHCMNANWILLRGFNKRGKPYKTSELHPLSILEQIKLHRKAPAAAERRKK